MIFVDALNHGAWMEWRKEGIGGSDAASIMGASPWETAFENWARRTGRLAPREKTYPMRRGLRLEPDARREYERRTGIRMPKQLGIHPRYSWLRGSFDGFNRELPRATEFKCPGKDDHGKACRGEVPEHYVWQLVHLLLVADIPEIEIDYFSFDPGNDRRDGTSALITFRRNEELEKVYLAEATRFWNCVLRDVPPNGNVIHLPKGRDVFSVRRKR